MFAFIGGLIEWVLDFVTSTWLVRKRRSMRGEHENSWERAATDVAFLDGLLILLFVLAVIGFVVLHYMLGLSFGLSLFLVAAPVSLYGGYRWYRLLWG